MVLISSTLLLPAVKDYLQCNDDLISQNKPNTVNVSLTTTLNTKLDLELLTVKSKNCIYGKFSALILRERYMYKNQQCNVTMMVFKSGRINCTGGVCISKAISIMNEMINKIKKIFNISTEHFIKVTNSVSIFSVMQQIDLYKLQQNIIERNSISSTRELNTINGEVITYRFDPEVFSGFTLYYKNESYKVTFKIFISGKVNIMGVTSEDDITKAYNIVTDILKTCIYITI